MKKNIPIWIVFLILIIGCKKEDEGITNSTTEQSTVTDIDGNVYHTVKIGTQVWMVENLKVTKYRNGDTIPNLTTSDEWNKSKNENAGAYCNYDNSVANGNTYGRLYNNYAVTDSRNLAPQGWHIPSEAEWATLISNLGSASIVGGNMKESGTSHWSSPNEGADNSTGFTALPGGQRYYDAGSKFDDIGKKGYWWTTALDPINDLFAMSRNLNYDSRAVSSQKVSRGYGLSVRCIKD